MSENLHNLVVLSPAVGLLLTKDVTHSQIFATEFYLLCCPSNISLFFIILSILPGIFFHQASQLIKYLLRFSNYEAYQIKYKCVCLTINTYNKCNPSHSIISTLYYTSPYNETSISISLFVSSFFPSTLTLTHPDIYFCYSS